MEARWVDGREKTDLDTRFEAFLSAYQQILRNTIVRLCPGTLGLHVDEIEQEVRMRLWRSLQHEKVIDNPASYIYKVVLTTTIDAIRRVKARREEQLDPAHEERSGFASQASRPPSPERVVAHQELVTKVKDALARLAADRRRAAGLYLQGLTLEEIASLLEWSESRTRNLVYRGLKDLRALLRADGIDYANE